MSKGIIIIFTLMVMAQATSTFAQGVEFFGAGGLTKFVDKDYDGDKSTPSIKIGIFAWSPLNDQRFSINTGFTYGNHGTKFETNTGDEIMYDLWYLSLTPDFVYRLKPLSSSFFVSSGVYGGYVMKAVESESLFGGGESLNMKVNEDDDGFKDFDFGINIGVGYIFENGLTLRMGYTKGLANIYEFPIGSEGSIKNSNMSLSIGYLILRNKKVI